MKLQIFAVGKLSRGPELDLVERYLARIAWPVSVLEFSEAKPPRWPKPAPQRRIIVLDEAGRHQTSRAFAGQLGRWRDEGARETCFLIGGADGHDAATRASADLLLSFGGLTWPHMLVRVMLAEQLYRALSILNNHPYHRD